MFQAVEDFGFCSLHSECPQQSAQHIERHPRAGRRSTRERLNYRGTDAEDDGKRGYPALAHAFAARAVLPLGCRFRSRLLSIVERTWHVMDLTRTEKRAARPVVSLRT